MTNKPRVNPIGRTGSRSRPWAVTNSPAAGVRYRAGRVDPRHHPVRLAVGAAAQWCSDVRRSASTGPWHSAPDSSGSFIGGLLASLIAGDGLELKPSGLIGSFIGAVLVTLVWRWLAGRRAPAEPVARRR